jgi:calcineurin-like phosphoesterase family protein
VASLSWLHLTDLHAGHPEYQDLWPKVRERFYFDLRRLHDRVGGWDVVFFTGDLTYQAEPSDFEMLQRFLGDFWSELTKLNCAPVLLAVPGNHDVRRPRPLRAAASSLRNWFQDPHVRRAFWSSREGKEYQDVVRRAFDRFTEWYGNWRAASRHDWYKSWTEGVVPGDFSITVAKDDLQIGVVGLNSAFLQLTEGDYERKLDVHVRQLTSVCGGDTGDWWRPLHTAILLTHHPSEWLGDPPAFSREIASPDRFLLHLHGHLHEGNARYLRIRGSDAVRTLQGTSLCGLPNWGENSARLHGYAAGKLDMSLSQAHGTLSVWPRILKLSKEGRNYYLAPDWDNFELDDRDAFRDTASIRVPDDSPSFRLLRSCLHLAPSQIIAELKHCQEVAEKHRLSEFQIARLRVEQELFAPPAEPLEQVRARDIWTGIDALAATLVGGTPLLDVQTSFALQRNSDAIRRYFDALKAADLPPMEQRFLSHVTVNDGYLAPIHLLSGLLAHFGDDWTPVLTSFSRSVAEAHSPPWRMPQSFIFNCWLLWGPSIPFCSCELWTPPDDGGLALQYGYGDESNSVPVYVPATQCRSLLDELWPAGPGPGHAGQIALARRASLTGQLVSVDSLAAALPEAQASIISSGKYSYAIHYHAHEASAADLAGVYYSAYVWMMFEITDALPASAAASHLWLRYLPFFEHTNIADGSTFDFMKEQLARKVLGFVARYRSESTRFRYVCAFDDPGHVPPASGGRGSPPVKTKIEELLRRPEFAALSSSIDLHPRAGGLATCDLPSLVESFYAHVSALSSPTGVAAFGAEPSATPRPT